VRVTVSPTWATVGLTLMNEAAPPAVHPGGSCASEVDGVNMASAVIAAMDATSGTPLVVNLNLHITLLF
jgi:hypothetical protein